MLRYYIFLLRNIFRLPIKITQMRKMIADVNCSARERYEYVRDMVRLMQKTSAARTVGFGMENLPEDGGYVMYPNHQGKYDAYGIVAAHEKVCTVVMDKAKSYGIFIEEILDLVKGKRLDKNDVRQAFRLMNEIAQEVEAGQRYIIFPEGEYDAEKKNTLREFKSGCFKASINSKSPIVPVVLVDSYKVWNSSSLGKVTTQVHFLPAIPYEEYGSLKTSQIAALVRERIQKKLDEILITVK